MCSFSTFPFLHASNAEKPNLSSPMTLKASWFFFRHKLGCQKPCWVQARLSSLANKQFVFQPVSWCDKILPSGNFSNIFVLMFLASYPSFWRLLFQFTHFFWEVYAGSNPWLCKKIVFFHVWVLLTGHCWFVHFN